MRRFWLWFLSGALLSLMLLVPVWVRGDTLFWHPAGMNRMNPFMKGLVSWWVVVPPLAGSGTWYDIIGGQHGTLTNMAGGTASGFGPTKRPDWWGEMRFDGVNDLVLAGPNSYYGFPNQTFTVALWYRATAVGTSAGYLVNPRNVVCCGGGWFIRIDTAGTITARVIEATAGTAEAQRTTVSTNHLDGTWRQLAVVFTTDTTTIGGANAVSIYVNGVLDQGSNFSNATTLGYGVCACPLAFGAQADQEVQTFVNGSIDSVRIWNYGLPASMIAQLHNRELPMHTGLVVPEDEEMLGPGTVAVTPRTDRFFPFFR